MSIFKKVVDEYGGHDCFSAVVDFVGEDELDKYCTKIYEKFCAEYTDAGYLLNVKWLLRHYFASKKMILSALFFKQTEFLNGKNLKNISFYTCYYSLFNALCSNIIINPRVDFEKIRKISHAQVFKDTQNFFIDCGVYDEKILDLLNDLRLTRELYSYHLPLGGSDVKEEPLNADFLFQRLNQALIPILQLSNLISYLSHFAWIKKVGKGLDEYDQYQSEVDNLFFSFIEYDDHLGKHHVMDDQDYRLQGEVLLKWGRPFPLSWFIAEKMCEELEIGWEGGSEDESNSGFDISVVAHFLAHKI